MGASTGTSSMVEYTGAALQFLVPKSYMTLIHREPRKKRTKCEWEVCTAGPCALALRREVEGRYDFAALGWAWRVVLVPPAWRDPAWESTHSVGRMWGAKASEMADWRVVFSNQP